MKATWRGLSPIQRSLLILGTATAAACLSVAARRDLAGRDAAAVRGDPDVWDRVTYLPGGAAAYLAFGRRKGDPADTRVQTPAMSQ